MGQCMSENAPIVSVMQFENVTFCITSQFGDKPLLEIMLPIAKESLKKELALDNGPASVYNDNWN